jgi:alkylated DNA nucleotide flippase Atl1
VNQRFVKVNIYGGYMPKKTYNEKLNFSGDLPKVIKLTNPRLIERYKTDTMVIAAPLEYDKLMKKVPAGKLTTIDRMMASMAKKHGAGCACPMTAGIFVNISAHASWEREGKNETPWWRTLKKDGVLNEKFPGGTESQKTRLEAEGHTITQKGKRWLVEGYEAKLCRL